MSKLETLMQDSSVMEELRTKLNGPRPFKKAKKLGVSNRMVKAVVESSAATLPEMAASRPFTEAVIMDFLRPCLIIQKNSFEVPESDEWKMRLEPYRLLLERRIPCVGRVELKYHPRYNWAGTCWLIDEDVVVTNAHVAAEFAQKNGSGNLVFKKNDMGIYIESKIDFREEYQSATHEAVEISVKDVIFMETEGGPDIALLKLSQKIQGIEPIPILNKPITEDNSIAVIGYPAYDPYRNPLKPEDVERIFGNLFDIKRLSPGKVLVNDFSPHTFTHDATTLGGNSGSVVLDLESGQAIGLHFKGVFHESNYAVKAHSLLDRLAKENIQVSIPALVKRTPEPVDDILEEGQEGRVEDYEDREGYQANFLGNEFEVPLPELQDKSQLLFFEEAGIETSILKYLHFSIEMNKERRLCYYSAVNINGGLYKKTRRPGWKFDPRIPTNYQIKTECYGNPPKFSRGHMTRREDPAWGNNLATATLGNSDSMHVTNAVPQMQTHNAGIWLGLEDYALQNAKVDAMNISVFTGPFFSEDDPIKFGVKIPVEFWKVIAFIHDETGSLCATGYCISQQSFLQEEEFIFGAHKTYQVSIKSIEERAGLQFGDLASRDPYQGFELIPSPLQDYSQIVFVP